jgi:hypothetical protein
MKKKGQLYFGAVFTLNDHRYTHFHSYTFFWYGFFQSAREKFFLSKKTLAK